MTSFSSNIQRVRAQNCRATWTTILVAGGFLHWGLLGSCSSGSADQSGSANSIAAGQLGGACKGKEKDGIITNGTCDASQGTCYNSKCVNDLGGSCTSGSQCKDGTCGTTSMTCCVAGEQVATSATYCCSGKFADSKKKTCKAEANTTTSTSGSGSGSSGSDGCGSMNDKCCDRGRACSDTALTCIKKSRLRGNSSESSSASLGGQGYDDTETTPEDTTPKGLNDTLCVSCGGKNQPCCGDIDCNDSLKCKHVDADGWLYPYASGYNYCQE